MYFEILIPYADVRFSFTNTQKDSRGNAASAASTGVLDLLFDLRVDISDVEFDAVFELYDDTACKNQLESIYYL